MVISRGRCLLKPLREQVGWSQVELSRRTGYNKLMCIGISPRMISHYEEYDGQGKGKPMSPEAMFAISRLLGTSMEQLYEWHIEGVAE